MKYGLFSILAVAIGLIATGCTVNELPVEEGTIRAVMEGDETRTSVTDAGVFTWSSEDQIWLHTTSGGVMGTLSSGAGTGCAQFYG